MNREEAYKIDILTSTGFDTRIVVDKIYDDFESRVCANCEYLGRGYCDLLDITIMSIVNQSCKGWELR